MAFTPTSHKGVIHNYEPRLVAFEQYPSSEEVLTENVIILIGGLGDGLFTIPFFSILANHLPPNWSIAQILLSSSYGGWGTGSITQDAREIAACVAYFRTVKKGKIVIMGHSTGSQDVMEYLVGEGSKSRPAVDGAILQACVSDREAMLMFVSQKEYDKTVAEAESMVKAGRGGEYLPTSEATSIFGNSVCARRWLSLASPHHDGEDDLFSSDLTDEQLSKTFGHLPASVPFCILYMGADEYVPSTIDKKALVDRWINIAEKGGANINKTYSGVPEGGGHNMNKAPKDAVLIFTKHVAGFVKSLLS